MPISIRFDDSGRYLIASIRGRILASDLRTAYEAFYAGNDVPLNTGELVDLSAADLDSLTHESLTEFARWGEEFLRARGDTARKTAFYMPGLPGRSKLVIYEVLVQESPEITRTFSNREEAARWLTDPSADSATRKPTR